jgi:hypothetical protein
MTVQQLIKYLQQRDPKATVLVSRDEEGNGFSPLVEVDGGGIWNRDDYVSHPDDVGKRKKNAICLWP